MQGAIVNLLTVWIRGFTSFAVQFQLRTVDIAQSLVYPFGLAASSGCCLMRAAVAHCARNPDIQMQ